MVYRFGPFEIDTLEGTLSRKGTRVKLQDLPYRLLVMLVERQGEIISRDDLRQHLWPEDTFVEFDNSLGVAIRKVRDSLGDDAEAPRYVETIPRRGYRFIAPVAKDSPTASASVEITEAPVAVQPSNARRRNTVTFLCGAVVVALALAGWFWWEQTRSRIPERALVVVGDFANNTGDPLFDGSLRRAVLIQLAQSPYLNLVPDKTLGDILQDLGRSPDDKLSPALTREVCQHGHGAALITGAIQFNAGTYLLSLDASRCTDGSSLSHQVVEVANQQTVLPRLGSMLVDLRRSLGESRASLQKFGVPVEQATTSSLEALKAYQLGLELRAHSKNLEARPAFKTAIALDPEFAIAYAQLGSSYSNVGESQEGKKYFRKAFELRSRATEPERLYITGRYFDIVTGESEKGSETYKLWTELYPDDWLPYNALANDANLMGRYETVVETAKQAIRINPNHNFGYINLLAGLTALNRLDEAKKICDQLVARGHDETFIHLNLFSLANLQHDEQALRRENAWAEKHPDDIAMLYAEAEAAAGEGKVKQSNRIFEDAVRKTVAGGDNEYAADTLIISAEINSEVGRNAVAEKQSEEALGLGKNQIVLGLAGLIEARAGNQKRSSELLDELDREYPLATFNLGVYSPMIRTVQAVSQGSSSGEVTSLMEPALPYELGSVANLLPIYVRAVSYLEVRSGADAQREFQKILDHHAVDAVTDLYPLSELGLARSYSMQGKSDDSRRAYQAFFTLWKDADLDVPILLQARREFRN